MIILLSHILLVCLPAVSQPKEEPELAGGHSSLRFLEDLAERAPGIGVEELVFIDRSFATHGDTGDAAFGDYSVGLESLAEEAEIEVLSEDGGYRVSLYGKSGAWEFTVHIRRGDGIWRDPVQFYGAEEPEPQPPEDAAGAGTGEDLR